MLKISKGRLKLKLHTQKIKIKEYKSTSIKGKSTRDKPRKIAKSDTVHEDLCINFLKLSTAMIKANITNSTNLQEESDDIWVASLSLIGLLASTDNKINLKDGFRKKYRDFSKSSRIGELGQAINYIFAQEKLGFRYVIDFETFLNWNKLKEIKGSSSTPDYVLIGSPATQLSVLESKGSSQKSPLTKPKLREKLQKAMDKQCTSGVNHLMDQQYSISNSYASVVELAEYSESRESILHFADPEYDKHKENDYTTTIRKFYSLWLIFLGIDEGYKLHDKQYDFEFPEEEFDIVSIEKNKYFLQKKTSQTNYLQIPIKFGISKDIVNYIEKGKYRSIYDLKTSFSSLENTEIFSDGTIAVFEPDKK